MRQLTVVIVADDPFRLRALLRALRAPGYQLVAAASIAAALEIAAMERVDLVVAHTRAGEARRAAVLAEIALRSPGANVLLTDEDDTRQLRWLVRDRVDRPVRRVPLPTPNAHTSSTKLRGSLVRIAAMVGVTVATEGA